MPTLTRKNLRPRRKVHDRKFKTCLPDDRQRRPVNVHQAVHLDEILGAAPEPEHLGKRRLALQDQNRASFHAAGPFGRTPANPSEPRKSGDASRLRLQPDGGQNRRPGSGIREKAPKNRAGPLRPTRRQPPANNARLLREGIPESGAKIDEIGAARVRLVHQVSAAQQVEGQKRRRPEHDTDTRDLFL